MSEIRERMHISILIEKARFLRIVSALTKKDKSDVVEIALDLLKHYINCGSAADDFLYYIEQKDPKFLEKLVAFRNKVNEQKVIEVVEA